MSVTQTGIPITGCDVCGFVHPESRKHCVGCGLATLFNHEFCEVQDVE